MLADRSRTSIANSETRQFWLGFVVAKVALIVQPDGDDLAGDLFLSSR